EPADGAVHLLLDRLVRPVRLVAAGDEAGDHRAEGPDAERGLHAVPPRARMTRKSPRTSKASHAAGRANASPGRTRSPAPSPSRTRSTPNRPAGSARSSTAKNSAASGGRPSDGSYASRWSASIAASQPRPRCASSGETGKPVHSQTIE